MSKDLDQLNFIIESNLKAADEARAYISITNEQGPSEQLLAFINFDNKLEDEIGFEGYNTLSLQARHEILLSKLNPSAMEAVAMEGLVEKIDKISKWMMVVGGASSVSGLALNFYTKSWHLTPSEIYLVAGGLILLTSANLVRVVNNEINGVISFEDFKKYMKACDSAYDHELFAYEHLPNDFNEKTWNAFVDKVIKDGSEGDRKHYQAFKDSWDAGRSDKSVGAVNSWTPENFKEASKWLKESSDKLKSSAKKYADKFNTIEKWVQENFKSPDPEVKKTIKLIYKSLDIIGDEFNEYGYLLSKSAKHLQKVSTLFKKK